MAWQLSVMRDKFEDFSPRLPASFGFNRKWRFLLWSLERQERRLAVLKRIFFQKVALLSESAEGPVADGSDADDDIQIEGLD